MTNVLTPSDDIDPRLAAADYGPAAPLPLARPIIAAGPVLAPSAADWIVRPGDDPMLLSEVRRRDCALDLLLFAIYMGGFLYVVMGGPDRSEAEAAETGGDHRLLNLVMTLAGGGLALVLVGLLTRMRGLGAASLGLTWRHMQSNVLLGLATTVASFAVFYLGIIGIWFFWPSGFTELQSNPSRIAESLPRLPLLGFAALTLCVGIYEETVFRGFLLTRLRRLVGSWVVAVPLAALIFALPHLEMQAAATAVPLFALAVLWSAIAAWRRSLVPGIIGHFLFNFIQLAGLAYYNPHWR